MDTSSRVFEIADQVAKHLARAHATSFLTGGGARDLLLGRAALDLDVSIAGPASPLARAWADASGYPFFSMDAEHDVARVIVPLPDGEHLHVDFARMRGERIEDDLATRDFTINAMALPIRAYWPRTMEGLVDPFHGREDVSSRLVRAVNDCVFQNDPVRLLRAVRQCISLSLELDPATRALIRRDASLLAQGAAERARDELFKILAAPDLHANLRELDDLGLLSPLLPELDAERGVTQSPPHMLDVFAHSLLAAASVAEAQARRYTVIGTGKFAAQIQAHLRREVSGGRTREQGLRLIALLHDMGKPATRSVDANGRIHYFAHEARGAEMIQGVFQRLRLSNDEIALARTVVGEHLRPLLLDKQETISHKALYHLFRDAGQAAVDVCVHSWADQRARGDALEGVDFLQSTLDQILSAYFEQPAQFVHPRLITGRDVIGGLDIEAGPEVGRWLEAVREAQAEGIVSTREQALQWIRDAFIRQKNPNRLQ